MPIPEEFVPVNSSSNILGVAYDPEDKSLYVQFMGRTASTYKYSNVDESVFTNMMNAESKGRFLHNEIKGVYEYERVS
jgi:hypothetical protein